jgi:hypothetical protein
MENIIILVLVISLGIGLYKMRIETKKNREKMMKEIEDSEKLS